MSNKKITARNWIKAMRENSDKDDDAVTMLLDLLETLQPIATQKFTTNKNYILLNDRFTKFRSLAIEALNKEQGNGV